MTIALSVREVSIILGATLMHWGVPFHFTAKRAVTDYEQVVLDELSQRLISNQIVADKKQSVQPFLISVTVEEKRLIIEMLSACIAECGNNVLEISLHLKADSKDEVTALIKRLQA